MRWAKAKIFTVVKRAEKSSKEAGGVKRRLLNISGEALFGFGLLVLELGRDLLYVSLPEKYVTNLISLAERKI